MSTTTQERRAVAVVADLMFRSRIEANLPYRQAGAAGTRWRLEVAEDGTAAARALATPADLVLVDLHTPGLDIEAVVKAAGDAPVVAFGRHTEPETLRAARRAGCEKALARSEFVEVLPSLFSSDTAHGSTGSPRAGRGHPTPA